LGFTTCVHYSFFTGQTSSAHGNRAHSAQEIHTMKHLLERLIAEDSGQDMIEYGLIAAIVALGTATVLRGLDNSIKNTFGGIGTSLTNAVL
jgi:pilus assembly protein Flp/PilA